ncbi:MAG: ABC transporter ATP-binding protein/permease [Deltaproteobacteria bacterium]|nr:ABC transporter ATP-binding protein/permease [Deltaproteobacteria bacterium]MBW2069053.1 ABC transporter ATP-binding protein/permease [Deltaproteobacteria bacterium]
MAHKGSRQEKRITERSLTSWIFKKYLGLQLLLACLIIVTIFFRVLPLEMQKRIINIAIGMKSLNRLFLYCGLYLVSFLMAGILKYCINVLQNYIGQKILYHLRTELYDHILQLPLNFFRKTPPGMVISSLTSELTVVGEFLGSAISTPLVNFLTLFTFAGYMIYLNPLLAIASFSVYPLEILIIPLFQKKYNRLNKIRIDTTRTLSNRIGEAISGIHEIHGNASFRIEVDRFDGVAKKLFKIRCKMNSTKYLIKFTNNFFQNMGPFVLFIFGGYLAIKGRLDLGALVAFLSAFEKLYDPWKELMEYYQIYQDAKVRYARVMSYFDQKPPFKLAPLDRELLDLSGAITVDNVAFYVDGHPILDQVSVSVGPGDQLALVGFSGSGKSTLVMILGQLYEYHQGHVKFDEIELKSLTKLDIGRNVGYIAQFPFIFEGTIRDNLLYACNAININLNPEEAQSYMPSEHEILETIENVGLGPDILSFGLYSRLDLCQERELMEQVLELRCAFLRKHRETLSRFIEYFEENEFLDYCSMATNLVFGFPVSGKPTEEAIAEKPELVKILKKLGLLMPMVVLGRHIVAETIELMKQVESDEFFLKSSPLFDKELPYYEELLKKYSGIGTIKQKDLWSFVILAFRYNPHKHPMVVLPSTFKEYVVRSRREFRKFIESHWPDEFQFIHPSKYLSYCTIFRNIIFGTVKSEYSGAEEAIKGAVIELIKKEGAEESLISKGLEFHVGTKGDRLSGGQKQKVAIARTLLKEPRILIMDEATASLDNASQLKIQQLLTQKFKGKRTVLSVVHRLETVKDYDQILVMKAGKIVERGSFDELMKKKGIFYELYQGHTV